MKEYIVNKEESNKRIDAYLSKISKDISRVTVQRLIEEGKILVNNKKIKSSYKVQENDNIIMEEDIPKEIELKAQDIPVEVIFEDNDMIVVNKPKGMVVHPANRKFGWNIGKCSYGYLQRFFIRYWRRNQTRNCS